MDNQLTNSGKQEGFSQHKQTNQAKPQLEVFQDPFSTNAMQQRSAMPLFAPFFEQSKGANIFGEEFPSQNIQNEAQNEMYKFHFGTPLFKESRHALDDPFNFKLEYELPDEARSYENKCEFNLELDLTNSPSFYSFDYLNAEKSKFDSNKAVSHFDGADEEEQIKPVEELKQVQITSNIVTANHFDNRSSPKSQYSCDSAKLEQLIRCLTKSKGVDVNCIDNDIVARTIEFGQQKVADELNIPYRRYKSILNKVGIKTTAGRKVKNLKLETDLVAWAANVRESQQLLTRKMIKEEAARIIRNLIQLGDQSLKKIKMSKGWLDKFVKRHPAIAEYITSQKGKKGL